MDYKLLENKLENFSKLSDQECASILQHYLLEMFELEDYTYLEWEIITKFIKIDYTLRDELCQLFESAIKKNEQKIAGITVGNWLKKYVEKNDSIAPNTENFRTFVVNDPETKDLDKRDQLRLMRIFRMYDYLFIVPILDLEGPAAKIIHFPMRLNSTPAEISAQFSQTNPVYKSGARDITKDIKIALNDALKNYPDLGEQIITSYRLNLKSFPEPVRPSIKNWISDYTFNVGYDHHDNMIRGNYLFQNPNAKNLLPEDREKLSYILKAFDENAPVTVNTATKQIIFPIAGSEQRTVDRKPRTSIGTTPARISFETRSASPSPGGLQNYPSPSQPASVSTRSDDRSSIQGGPIPSIFHDANYQSPSFHHDMPNQMTIRRAPVSSSPAESVKTAEPERLTIKPPTPVSEGSTFRAARKVEPSAFKPGQVIRRETPIMPGRSDTQSANQLINKSTNQPEPIGRSDNYPDTQTHREPVFSSPQKLPYEKIIQKPAEAPPPSASPIPGEQSHPYHITSSSSQGNGNEKEEEPLPRNVVNLKSRNT